MSDVDPVVMQSLSCDEVEAMLPMVADGALDAESDPQLFEHLASCESCQQSLVAYDIINLSLGRGAPPARPRSVVYRLPLPFALAAGLLLAVGLGALAWALWPAGAPAPIAARPVADAEPPAEIIEVIWPGPGHRVPIYIIRHGDETIVVDQARLDGGQGTAGTGFGTTSAVVMPEEAARREAAEAARREAVEAEISASAGER